MSKLLKFCQDFGDEINIVAQEVMTDDEYTEWCNLHIGHENPNYDEEMQLYEDNQNLSNSYYSMLRSKGYLYLKVPLEDTEAIKLQETFLGRVYMSIPTKVYSYLEAYIGNFDMDNCFAGDFSNYTYARELVSAGLVYVFDVSEDFYNTFKRTELNRLSICNIFDTKRLKECHENR